MPRSARVDVGEEIYHVINRANADRQKRGQPPFFKLREVRPRSTKRRLLRLFFFAIPSCFKDD